jgi:hypothetical protein
MHASVTVTTILWIVLIKFGIAVGAVMAAVIKVLQYDIF